MNMSDQKTILNKKGKNFSCNNTGKRKESDFYETPYSMTEQFLIKGHFNAHEEILEPACGQGAIVRVLQKLGCSNIISYDIEKNFLSETVQYDQIITNPPFSLADDFILKAKEIARHRFAFLLPLSYLHGKKRYDKIWSDNSFPLSKLYVFTRYPMLGNMLRDDGCYKTGMMVYAWYLWERESLGPIIDWIDNNNFVLNSKNTNRGDKT